MANEKHNKNGQQNGNVEKKIIIAERDNIAAVLENGKVTDFFISRGDVILGDVYLAIVDNILPSIDAAFVNVGVDKMGFLHAQDVMGKGSLKDKLSPKQKLIVQVVKEPTGHKGPRVTTEISLPGRFLVLMPNEPGISISKKIENSKERARLKSVVSLIKPVGVGVIIRTEAEGQSEADIQEDLEILLEKWNNIITAAETMTPPNLLYRDQDLLYRTIREACTEDVREIVVDTPFAMQRVQNILQNWHINKNIQVTLYKGTEPLLVATDIHKEIKAALNVKVNMPSGGYLFIQQTEALTVIDVNSGKFTSSSTQDETILKTNIEAVHEIARQLRLRNIGGMIIVDFIDMMSRADKLAMLEELEIALEPDKAKPQVGQISDLGLVELTRHRQGQSLSEIFTRKCPHCQGTGYFMNEFNFATPTAEGEYRAKAAKMKLPVNNFKKNKNNNNNKNQNSQIQEQENQIINTNEKPEVQKPEIEVENPSTVAIEKEKQDNKKKRRTRKSKFEKKDQEQTVNIADKEIETAQTVLKPNEEIKPVIDENTKIENSEPEKTENENKETLTAETPQEQTEEKPKKTRRPNRGASKTRKPRTKKIKEANEEKVEE